MLKRSSLSQNKEFKSIKNAAIQETMNIFADRIPIENAEEQPDPNPEAAEMESSSEHMPDELTEQDAHDTSYSYGYGQKKKQTWWTDEYKQERKCLYGTKDIPSDFEKALTLMLTEAVKGNGYAMHDLGKMYLSGLGCEKNEEQAQEWFAKAKHSFIAEESKAKKKAYLQFRIGKLFSFGYGVEQDYLKAAEWYMKAMTEDNPFTTYALRKKFPH